MPRSARLDFPGARHHVMNRGARRQATFRDDEDCLLFLSVLSSLPRRYGLRIHAYVLMPNHFHLMLESKRGNLSDAMQYLGGEFTRRLNARLAWDGPLFRGRFRNRVVNGAAYWRHLLAYLHLNPVDAHLAGSPEDVPWSSHDIYLGRRRRPEWLTTSELLAEFGGVESYRRYVDEVQVGRNRGPDDFDPAAMWVPPRTGTDSGCGEPTIHVSGQEATEVIVEVARVTGVPPEHLLTARPGREGNPRRWMVAWALIHSAGSTHAEVARMLDTPRSGVTQMLRRLEHRRNHDPEVAGWLDAFTAE